MNTYRTLAGRGSAEIVERKSRFLCDAAPARDEAEALAFLAEVRASRRGASHHVFAYVAGLETVSARYGDDGEPAGSAGLPVMEVLKKLELRDAALVVTRYFGGTLLGAAGLVRAYSKAAAAGIEAAGVARMALCERLRVRVPFALAARTEACLRRSGIVPGAAVWSDGAAFPVSVETGKYEALRSELMEACGSAVEIVPLGRGWERVG